MSAWILDYGAGNVQSVRNAIKFLGYNTNDISNASDLQKLLKSNTTETPCLIFPGVGAFGQAMKKLKSEGLDTEIKNWIESDKPFLGVCLGMQLLFEGSDESPGVPGIGCIPGMVKHFNTNASVPHIGWNSLKLNQINPMIKPETSSRFYFVHSYRALKTSSNTDWVCTETSYGGETFISSVSKGNVFASQCHPEKSGHAGLLLLKSFLEKYLGAPTLSFKKLMLGKAKETPQGLGKRVIACLDVRSNDQGDLVVTKGDQYDVRESSTEDKKVRNLGKPVQLAERYYHEGADEIVFLNITSFRESPLEDMPMLSVLEQSSKKVFVPLTVGGGIRDYKDSTGKTWSALDVAARYFRAGADKVSIGSDAVYAAEKYYTLQKQIDAKETDPKEKQIDASHKRRKVTFPNAITSISERYGRQAVVISFDPRRVYVTGPEDPRAKGHEQSVTKLAKHTKKGPNGEGFAWWQCTIKGGRETRDIDVQQLAIAVEALGAGELLVNCVNEDGQGSGYDHALLQSICDVVSIPVIASSGAGNVKHFSDVFRCTSVDAALAAGIFHRREVPINDVKAHLKSEGIPCRKN